MRDTKFPVIPSQHKSTPNQDVSFFCLSLRISILEMFHCMWFNETSYNWEPNPRPCSDHQAITTTTESSNSLSRAHVMMIVVLSSMHTAHVKPGTQSVLTTSIPPVFLTYSSSLSTCCIIALSLAWNFLVFIFFLGLFSFFLASFQGPTWNEARSTVALKMKMLL